tara:strand:+ start:1178 stop:1384 length:207 start_codon:yes stop_codon:yes gene_type:complete
MDFSRLVIAFKNNPNNEDVMDGGVHIVEYVNVTLKFSGDYLILTKKEDEGEVKGFIYPMNAIQSFKSK